MSEKIAVYYKAMGLPRLIITLFFLFLVCVSVILGIPFGGLMTDVVVRLGMHGILVLAMVPAIISGIGLNFGLPLGILCGLIGAIVSIELDLVGFPAFIAAILVALPLAALIGWCYGWLLNKVKGSEMMVATYAGFSAVFLMSIGWMVLPFKSPEITWPMGPGLRTTISLDGRFRDVLNNWGAFNIGSFRFPTGLILFFLLSCFIMWLVLRSKTGIAMKTVGANPNFAVATGLNVDNYRIMGSVLSTILGAVGIIVYSQSYGFLQLYQAPMFMGFAAVAAVLIGGANIKNAKISHVIIGTFLFQGLLVIALPVANTVMTTGSLAEITRLIVTNGIILYALTQVDGGE
ncbi:ABC transporter permease subunit [Alkaliphilus peptidifermentans]|uniref:Monosaccharide ABC transporter membrane protein, CUT2 family (TC 3.A.1.2.-) n=1 Tax=Alkaliphilus peptidifermentans DSM 18978 TaxID=1120976 RepID=A0A1G5EM86_9FIRM|nr:ABC transporter [Alkaliphilus peptidifermentans]SCY28113.1 monosaccharide ABC transporter membrane protein, CUT2 family (TC 3.A.1.2.-) [Alkaliphilus peptidifermentans DSM 18978]